MCHVLRVKMERYKKERTGSQEMEEYLKTLLDTEVKPLWPKGWMQSRYVTLVQIHTFSHMIFILLKVLLYLIVHADRPFLNICCFRVLIRESRKMLSPFKSLP